MDAMVMWNDYIQLFKDDALGVGGTLEGGRLPNGSKTALAVGVVGPARDTTVSAQLARGMKSTGLALA